MSMTVSVTAYEQAIVTDDDDVSCTSLRSYLSDLLGDSQQHNQNEAVVMIVDDNASRHSTKMRDSHVSFQDCCRSSGSQSPSTSSSLSNNYTLFKESIEQRKMFHKDDRWSTSSSASSSSSSSSFSSPSQLSKSPCPLPVRRKSVATRGGDEDPGCQMTISTSSSIYYCPLTRDDNGHRHRGGASDDESSSFRRVRRPRRLRENKWGIKQERRHSLPSMTSSPSDSSTTSFADLPPRMPRRLG